MHASTGIWTFLFLQSGNNRNLHYRFRFVYFLEGGIGNWSKIFRDESGQMVVRYPNFLDILRPATKFETKQTINKSTMLFTLPKADLWTFFQDDAFPHMVIAS